MNDDDIYLSVSDNGCGIVQHDLDRIFDPFFTTKKVGEGDGVGIVHQLQHRGKIGRQDTSAQRGK